MFVLEASGSTHELELAGRQLMPSILREFLDQLILARHDLAEVKTDLARVNSPNAGASRQVQDITGIEQCLCGHATAQDAKSADIIATFNHCRTQPRVRSGPCCRIAATATPDDGDIEIEMAPALTHSFNNAALRRGIQRRSSFRCTRESPRSAQPAGSRLRV